MLKTLITILLSVLSAATLQAADNAANPICGKYHATDGGATIEIIPLADLQQMLPAELNVKYTLADQFVIILGDNPSPELRPGTIMGWLTPLAKPGLYNAVIFTKEKKGMLSSPKKFLLEMNADGTHLSMLEIKHKLRIDPLRFLPYLFHGISLKGTLKYDDNRREDVEGFIKFYPRPRKPHVPRQL